MACLRQLVTAHLRRATETHRILAQPDAMRAADLLRRASALADRIEAEPDLLGKVIASGRLAQGRLELRLDPSLLATTIAVPEADLAADLVSLSEPFTLRRRGVETKIIAGETIPAPDPVLKKTLAEAHAWARALRGGTSLTEIARKTGRSEPYIRTRIPLAFLAPRIQEAILDGHQPPDLSVAQLIRDGIPMGWSEQARLFRIK